VTRTLYDDATAESDPLLGATLLANEGSAPAKLVDLDPEQQMVSTIFGMRLTLRAAAGRAALAGDFTPAPFTDLWARFPAGAPSSFFGAAYQSVLTDVVWPQELESPLLAQLRQRCAEGMLSIKFNVDGFNDGDPASPEFSWGRIVGTIGPYLAGEPRCFLAARMLAPAAASPLNNAPFVVDRRRRRLSLDLGNALPTTAVGGPPQDLGVLTLVARGPDDRAQTLAVIDTSSTALYAVDAGIVTAELSAEQAQLAAAQPLQLCDPAGRVLLAERPDGRYVRADDFVFRVYPVAKERKATTTLYATTFGAPAPRARIAAWMDNSPMAGQVEQGPISGPPVGVPADAVKIPAHVTTGPDGTAELTVTANPPGNPRGYIDGQVYGVAYGWDGDPGTAAGNALSLLVWDAHPLPTRPNWTDDVQPLLTQYANLYPVMRDIVDLSDYHSVCARAGMLEMALELPASDPNSMPVTRDLSPGKRATILAWLGSRDRPVFGLTDLDALRRLLQIALEIEHATIPAYLYALFSIKAGRNPEVAEIIRSIVVEEMMHMALVANILNAVGGAPAVNAPGFVPRYPGHLPGSVRPDLRVSLRGCSLAQIEDVFMAIELPSETRSSEEGGADTEGGGMAGVGDDGAPGGAPRIDTSAIDVDEDGRALGPVATTADQIVSVYTGLDYHPYTIGWFYGTVLRLLVKLAEREKIFTGAADRQITPKTWPEAPGRLYRVKDLRTAALAIHEIVEQGEGTSPSDPRGVGDELAHYFRFQEIVKGRRLVRSDSGEWAFTGAPVVFDPDGVWPVVADPQLVDYPNPAAQAGLRLFDGAYGDLLSTLHAVFNGERERLTAAVGLMFSLETLAQNLMQTPIAVGGEVTAGPRFAV
jgi:Ferritin-like